MRTIPLGPCLSCGHPARWHATDRAVEPPCLRMDSFPVLVRSVFARTDSRDGKHIEWDAYPVCGRCTGYQEDKHALYLQVCGRLASRRHMCTLAGATQ